MIPNYHAAQQDENRAERDNGVYVWLLPRLSRNLYITYNTVVLAKPATPSPTIRAS